MTSWHQCRFLMTREMKYCCPAHSEYSVLCTMIDTSCADLTGEKHPLQQLQTLPCTPALLCVKWVAIFCCYTLFSRIIHLAAGKEKAFSTLWFLLWENKEIRELTEFLNYVSLCGISAVQVWIINTWYSSFLPF